MVKKRDHLIPYGLLWQVRNSSVFGAHRKFLGRLHANTKIKIKAIHQEWCSFLEQLEYWELDSELFLLGVSCFQWAVQISDDSHTQNV